MALSPLFAPSVSWSKPHSERDKARTLKEDKKRTANLQKKTKIRDRKVHTVKVVDAKTETEYAVDWEHSSKEELAKVSPSNLIKAALAHQAALNKSARTNQPAHLLEANFRNQVAAMWAGGPAMSTMKRFPSEALIFYAAMGATMAQDTLIFDPYTKGGRVNPNWLDTLVHELTSPIGIAGFAAFMLASSQTSYSLFHAAHAIEKHSRNAATMLARTKKDHASRRNALSKTRYGSGVAQAVRALSGQLGMAAGMIASNIVHEFAYDPNVMQCIEKMKNPSDPMSDSAACDRAFDHWVLSPHSRIYDWMPDIVAMLSASVVSHLILNKGVLPALRVGFHKKLPISVKGFLMQVGQKRFLNFGPPLVHVGVTFLNLYTFMTIHSKVTDHAVARPWKRARKSEHLFDQYLEVQEEFSRIEKANFVHKPKMSTACLDVVQRRKQLAKINRDHNAWAYAETQLKLSMAEKGCERYSTQTPKVIRLLGKYAQQQTDWRSFNLETAWMAFTGWQESVGKLIESHEYGYNIYYDFFQKHAWFKGEEHASKNPYQDTSPAVTQANEKSLHEISLKLTERIDSYFLKETEFAQHPEYYTSLFATEGTEASESTGENSDENSDKNDNLNNEQINFLNNLTETQTSLFALRNFLWQTSNNLGNNSGKDQEQLVSSFVAILQEIVGGEFSTKTTKVFSELREIVLADLPSKDNNMAYLDKLNAEKDQIFPSFKSEHPKRMQRIQTPRSVDYLLTSMVCGPKAENLSEKLSPETLKIMENIESADVGDSSLSEEFGASMDKIYAQTKEFKSPLIKEPFFGIGYQFIPPRIVKEDVPDNFCNQSYNTTKNTNDKKDHSLSPRLSKYHKYQATNYTPYNILIKNEKTGDDYHGLLPYLKDHIPQQLLEINNDNGKLQFDVWWGDHVKPIFYKKIGELRHEYRQLMEQQFFPAFYSEEIKTQQVSLSDENYQRWKALENQWIVDDKHVPLLREKPNETHRPEGHLSKPKELTLPNGVMKSFRQEIPIWLGFLHRLTYSSRYNSVDRLLLLKKGKIIINKINEMEESLRDFSTSQGVGFMEAYQEIGKTLEEIGQLFEVNLRELQQMPPKDRIASKSWPVEQQITALTLLRLASVAQELMDHRGILQLIPDEK